ncbi:ubiquitin-like-conjugating enzyme ATG10 [Malaya genurostris]|uniref:ubiquitin-like-conjugating enzyme ATG10 n=1 Tax=Malaya genurostris TaxID=325434 RepID=UPI0026F3E33C|nr:ubiquitin-like-conjugating enzyme ATG10 [Malaya genurostris]
MTGTLTEQEFLAAARQFLNFSLQIHDDWELIESQSGTAYLKKSIVQSLVIPTSENEESLNELLEDDPSLSKPMSCLDFYNFEYHIIYSTSYQVPVLYFNVHKSNGTLLKLEEAWAGFRQLSSESSEQLHQILTQMEHPVLFKPFLALHPCQTSNVLCNLRKSNNLIVSFISSFGPFINLNLSLEYSALTK